MSGWLVIAVIFAAIAGIYFSYRIPTGPSKCPKCKKEYQKAEEWSYGDYLWGARCPHCKHEFDVTP
ncbi:hypothetical protein P59_166 [Bacillus phage P59]|nr:hypothetical protein P59_166 [Bacillus phage P59]